MPLNLCLVLKHAEKCFLTSLTLGSTVDRFLEDKEIAEHLVSIVAQPTLIRLELLSGSLCRLVFQFKSSLKSKHRHLRMSWFPEAPMSEMTVRSPEPNTLVLDATFSPVMDDFRMFQGWSTPLCPELTSVTLWKLQTYMNKVYPFCHKCIFFIT